MRMTEKGSAEFDIVRDLNERSFPADLRAGYLALQFAFDNGEVFAEQLSPPFGAYRAFAVVTTQNGQPFLWAIGTAPQWRGHGIAGRLLEEIIAFYQGKDYIDLTVHVDNPAQKLYFDHGWRVKQVLRGYYKGQIDGLRMRRML